jgi:hypothetical protein
MGQVFPFWAVSHLRCSRTLESGALRLEEKMTPCHAFHEVGWNNHLEPIMGHNLFQNNPCVLKYLILSKEVFVAN